MSSPEKKRKKTTTNKPFLKPSPLLPLWTANLSLPYDLLLNCIARLSRQYYPTLSLVCKSYRSLLKRTESCLYVCLCSPHDPNPRWFTLSRTPNRTLTRKKKLSDSLLVPITLTSPHYTPVRSSFVAVGSDIYKIGGLINGVSSSSVSILDCRSNTWHKAPNMEVARERPYATVINGKILVKGGQEFNSGKWVEVFDPEIQTWRSVSYTDGYKEWKSPDGKGRACQSSCSCVIDDVWYSYHFGMLRWFDTKVNHWRSMKGLEGLPKFLFEFHSSCAVGLANYGGKMALLWYRHDRSSRCQENMISCAVVTLERCSSEEISGTVEWSDAVLKVPKFFEFVHVLAATV